MTAETVEGARAARRRARRRGRSTRGEHAEHASPCGEPGRIHAGSIMPGFASDVRTRALESALTAWNTSKSHKHRGAREAGDVDGSISCACGQRPGAAGRGRRRRRAGRGRRPPGQAARGGQAAHEGRVRADREQAADVRGLAARAQPHQERQEGRGAGALDALQALARGEGRADDPARDHDDHAGPGGRVPHRLRAQRRRRMARRGQARLAGRLAEARRRLLGRLQGGQHGRRARDLGHRRRARQLEHLRRHPVPAQHRARRRARPVSDPRRPGRHRATGARDRPGLGVRADAGRGPRRPLGPHLRGLLRGPADHPRLRLRGDPRPPGLTAVTASAPTA